jgi:hypothetical protein
LRTEECDSPLPIGYAFLGHRTLLKSGLNQLPSFQKGFVKKLGNVPDRRKEGLKFKRE